MVAFTRNLSRQVRDYIVSTMLDRVNDTTFSELLSKAGIDEFEDLTSMTEAQVQALTYTTIEDGKHTIHALNGGSKNKIMLLVKYLANLQQTSDYSMTVDNWLTLPADGFHEYRIRPVLQGVNVTNGNPNLAGGGSNIRPPEDKLKMELDAFKRSIKRDATQYPTLREDKDWDGWNRGIQSQARTHDMSEVLNPIYVPKDEVTKAIFDQKQSFMYSVFNRVVLTDMGKTIVRKHEHTYDAQKVYSELNSYAKTSAAATINIENITEQLTMMRLDSRWSGSTKGFVLHWRDSMRKLEELTPIEEHFNEVVKKRMLESAVSHIAELRQVKIQDEHTKAIGGKALTYLDYVELLLSAATRRDAELKLPPQRSRRNVNIASSDYNLDNEDLYYAGFNDYNEEVNNYTDQADVNYDVNIANSQFIPGNIWHKMPPEVQAFFKSNNKPNNKPKPGFNRPNNRFGSKPMSYQPNSSNGPPRKANAHSIDEQHDEYFYECDEALAATQDIPEESHHEDFLVNKSEQGKVHPGDLRNVLASAGKPTKKPNMQATNSSSSSKDFVIVNGKTYYAKTTMITYSTFSQHVVPRLGSLVDRGANGGIAGCDVMLIETSHRTCDVCGIDNHTMQGLPISTCAGLVKTIDGPIIVILHQYAYSGKGSTIHSAAQIEHFGNHVDDKSIKVNGRQQINTIDGYVISLSIRNGLAYIDMYKPTQHEYESLPHILLTSDVDWNPTVLDYEGDNIEDTDFANSVIVANLVDTTTTYVDCVDQVVDTMFVKSHNIEVNQPKFDLLRPNFAYAPVNIVQKTFECTTQWARMNERYPFRKHFKSRFPAFNVPRRDEPVASDTIFADTCAIGNGCYLAQIFVGCKTKVTDVYPMKLESEFAKVLVDSIRHRGAMSKLVSDYAAVETSNKVKDVLRHYCIDAWQSEPYHQHQNPAERRYQTIKTYTTKIQDLTGAPPETWFLCLKYVCYVLNLTYVDKLGTVPLQKLTGQTQDISILLPFSFWEPVYYATGDALAYNAKVSFPSASAEGKGRFVGFGESVGDALTFLVLTNDTKKLLYRSSVRSALTTPPNLRLEKLEGETAPPNLTVSESDDDIGSSITQPSLVDNTIGESVYDKLVFPSLPKVTNEQQRSIKDYNNVLDNLEHQFDTSLSSEDKLWRFNKIVDHVGPLKPSHEDYKGSIYNLLVEWGDGSLTYEPLSTIAEDDPVSCMLYAKENGLLDKTGWKRLKTVAKDDKRLNEVLESNKAAFKPNSPKFKFGFQVPRSISEAYKLDKQLGQTKWTEAIQAEINQIHSYETFKNLGKGEPAPEGYKKIKVHFVFDVKHDGRHKARLVAGGHLTDDPDDSVYSSVVSLRDLRLVIFAGELHNLDCWAADVGNAYLESYTKEKVYVIAGPEFAELEGCTLVIDKALYGLRSSGLRWHERFADTLRDLGFKPCKASVDVWMKTCADHYEYIAVYVDDLAIVAKKPKVITDLLVSKYGYKLKGVGPIDYHLGGNFSRDNDGTLKYGPKKYIDKLIMSYTKLFGVQPKEWTSPLVKGDHPELDDSPELDAEGIKQYQSMIGALQWTVSLGRFDILAAVMTMSRFRIAPRLGHLDRLKRIYGYLKKFKNGSIRFRTNQPDYSELYPEVYDWSNSVYGNDVDDLPSDVPAALGQPVVTTTYVDANLMHCMTTGRASTGILHLVNGTPIDWYSKRQATVQSATYGSEFVAARIATDQVIDLKLTLSYMGIHVTRAVMFGDNKSVVTSGTIPQSKLNKRHVALSYHRVREAIATQVLEFYHIDGDINPADMLSKFAGNQQFWPILRSLLFWGVGYNFDKKEGDKEDEE